MVGRGAGLQIERGRCAPFTLPLHSPPHPGYWAIGSTTGRRKMMMMMMLLLLLVVVVVVVRGSKGEEHPRSTSG